MRHGLIGLMILLTGCGLFGPEDELDAYEAEALLLGIRSLVQEETAEIIALEDETALIRCPSGGQARVTIEELGEEALPLLKTILIIEPEKCAFQSNSFDFFIPDGLIRDSLTIEFSKSFTTGLKLSGGTSGTIAWGLDGREGSCVIAMVLQAEAILTDDYISLEGEYVGTVCGHDIEIEATALDS